MNLAEAYDYMDMLLDKAEQPYFTTIEKGRYLDLAISEFVNANYGKMGADEDSRRAIANCIDRSAYDLTEDDIASGAYIYKSFPGLSEKYTNEGVVNQDGTIESGSAFAGSGQAYTYRGFFKYGNQYILPKNHLFTISIQIDYYNREEVINLETGEMHPGKSAQDVVSERVIPKPVSPSEYYEKNITADPFQSINTKANSFARLDYQQKNKKISYWAYQEGRINTSHSADIRRFTIESLILPTAEQAFSDSTMGGNSPAPSGFTFSEHYQRKILQLAVRKAAGVTETGDYQIKSIEAQK